MRADDNIRCEEFLILGGAKKHHGTIQQRGVQRSIGFMVQHQAEPLDVAKLATVANICPSHYFAVFKKATGFPPMAFFIRLRMQRACQLLESSQLSVREVADLLGYEDPFYFSRVFRSVNGLAPSDYRTIGAARRRIIRQNALPLRNGLAALVQRLQQNVKVRTEPLAKSAEGPGRLRLTQAC